MKHTVTEIKLKHGTKGILVDIPDASVMAFDFNFRAGEYLASERTKIEVPHVMEHLSLGANKRIRSSRAFHYEFDRNGAYCNASTGSYHVEYNAECADFEWARILDLLTLSISEPIFKRDEFEAELGNIREELTMLSNNHFRHLSLAMRKANGYVANMTEQERLKYIKNVTLEDIREHYKKTHHKPNLRFAIGGNIKERQKDILSVIEAMPLNQKGERFALPDEAPTGVDRALYIENPTIENMYFIFETYHHGALSEKEWDAISLLNNILIDTFHSRILAEAREKGIVYNMGGSFQQTSNSVSWYGASQVRAENAMALFEIVIREYKRVLDGKVDDQDLEDAKSYSLGRYQRGGAQTVGGTMNFYTSRYFLEDIIDDFYAVPARIAAVKKSTVIDTARKLFADKRWCLGILGQCPQDLQDALHEKLSVLWV